MQGKIQAMKDHLIKPNVNQQSRYSISKVIAVFITNSLLHNISENYHSISALMEIDRVTVSECKNKKPDEILDTFLNAWVEAKSNNATINNFIGIFDRLKLANTADKLRAAFPSDNTHTELVTNHPIILNNDYEDKDSVADEELQKLMGRPAESSKDKPLLQTNLEQQKQVPGSGPPASAFSNQGKRQFSKPSVNSSFLCKDKFGKKTVVIILLCCICFILSVYVVIITLSNWQKQGPAVDIGSGTTQEVTSKPTTEVALSDTVVHEPHYFVANKSISVHTESDYKSKLKDCNQIQHIHLTIVIDHLPRHLKILCRERVIDMQIIVKTSVNYTTLANIIGGYDNVRNIEFDVHGKIVSTQLEKNILDFMFPKPLDKLESISTRCSECDALFDLLGSVFKIPKLNSMKIIGVELNQTTANLLQNIWRSSEKLDELYINGTAFTCQLFSDKIVLSTIRTIEFNIVLASNSATEHDSGISLCSFFPNLNKIISKTWVLTVEPIKYCFNLKELDLIINDIQGSKLHSLKLFTDDMPQLETLRLSLNYSLEESCPNHDFPGIHSLEDDAHLQEVTIRSIKCPILFQSEHEPFHFQVVK